MCTIRVIASTLFYLNFSRLLSRFPQNIEILAKALCNFSVFNNNCHFDKNGDIVGVVPSVKKIINGKAVLINDSELN